MSAWSDVVVGSWGPLLVLGAFHGVNPGMGWLFAVALGMQENRAAAVWRALLPLGIGHVCAVAAAILTVLVAGTIVPPSALRWPIAAILLILGARRLLRHRHPRWGSMRIGMGGLTIWSFLVATAHGAGLMVLPVWLHSGQAMNAHSGHHMHASGDLASGITATAVHGTSYLIVTALIAWIVFSKVGVGLLRTAWINLDLIWAVALIVSGALTLTL
jgi:hypothetical protein